MGQSASAKMIYKLSEEYYVRSLGLDDLEGPYPSWFSNQDVCKFNSHGKFFKTKAWFETYIKNIDHGNLLVWAICHIEDGHIGNMSLQGINIIDRTAELAVLIGESSHWGKGVGNLAGKKIIYHGFQKLGLHKIYCGTAATNHGMRKLATSLGMQEEGIRKEHLFLEGKRVDLIEYGIINSNIS